MGEPALRSPDLARSATICCALGALLILASLLPLGKIVAHSQWTEEDSTAYDRISLEYKKAAYQDHRELGLSEEEQAVRIEKLKSAVDAMTDKLRNARMQGDVWPRRLRWIGLATTALGIVLHLAGRGRSA